MSTAIFRLADSSEKEIVTDYYYAEKLNNSDELDSLKNGDKVSIKYQERQILDLDGCLNFEYLMFMKILPK
jgi:hypothetical protein